MIWLNIYKCMPAFWNNLPLLMVNLNTLNVSYDCWVWCIFHEIKDTIYTVNYPSYVDLQQYTMYTLYHVSLINTCCLFVFSFFVCFPCFVSFLSTYELECSFDNFHISFSIVSFKKGGWICYDFKLIIYHSRQIKLCIE